MTCVQEDPAQLAHCLEHLVLLGGAIPGALVYGKHLPLLSTVFEQDKSKYESASFTSTLFASTMASLLKGTAFITGAASGTSLPNRRNA